MNEIICARNCKHKKELSTENSHFHSCIYNDTDEVGKIDRRSGCKYCHLFESDKKRK